MDEGVSEPWGPRFNRALAAVLLLLVLFAAVQIGSVWGFVFALPFWLYAFAVALLLEWGVLKLRMMGPPAIPLLPARFQGRPAVAIALVAYVLVYTGLREGVFEPVAVSFDYWESHSSHQVDTNSTSNRTGDEETTLMAGRYVSCTIHCEPGGTVCDAFLENLRCDNHGDRVPGPDPVEVDVRIDHGGEPFCYTPLLKEGDLHAVARIEMDASRAGQSAHHSVTMDIDLEQTMNGVASCRTFRRKLGEILAQQIAGSLQDRINED